MPFVNFQKLKRNVDKVGIWRRAPHTLIGRCLTYNIIPQESSIHESSGNASSHESSSIDDQELENLLIDCESEDNETALSSDESDASDENDSINPNDFYNLNVHSDDEVETEEEANLLEVIRS